MPQPLRVRVGRARVTRVVSPAEASYIRSINAEMRQIVRNMTTVVKSFDKVTPEILENALTPTFNLSQRLVPMATGRLKRSGYLESGVRNGISWVEIGYGKGGNPPYTVFVHEKQEIRHAPPTRAKFMQAALQETQNIIMRRVFEGYRDLI